MRCLSASLATAPLGTIASCRKPEIGGKYQPAGRPASILHTMDLLPCLSLLVACTPCRRHLSPEIHPPEGRRAGWKVVIDPHVYAYVAARRFHGLMYPSPIIGTSIHRTILSYVSELTRPSFCRLLMDSTGICRAIECNLC